MLDDAVNDSPSRRFESRLQLLVDGPAHLLELRCVFLPDRVEPPLDALAQRLLRRRVALRQVAHGLFARRKALLQCPRHLDGERADGRRNLFAQRLGVVALRGSVRVEPPVDRLAEAVAALRRILAHFRNIAVELQRDPIDTPVHGGHAFAEVAAEGAHLAVDALAQHAELLDERRMELAETVGLFASSHPRMLNDFAAQPVALIAQRRAGKVARGERTRLRPSHEDEASQDKEASHSRQTGGGEQIGVRQGVAKQEVTKHGLTKHGLTKRARIPESGSSA